MPINSSSIPALRIAREIRRKRRAEGGGLWGDIGGALPEAYGADSPIRDPLVTVPKSILYDLPKKAVDEAARNPMPGLRREDYTDIPPDTTPDPNSPLGGVGISVPRQGAQPVDPMVGASLEVAMNGAGVNMPFAKPGTAGIFGGRLAQTADHEALVRAESMAAAGAAPEQIWKDTGWFKGADDKWRFEINDAASGYKRQVGRGSIDNYPISNPHTTNVGTAYDHPELYAAYPDLKEMPLAFRPLDGANGQYIKNQPSPGDLIPPHERVTINTPLDRYGENMKQARSTTLHELQHAVQSREGFVPGGNPEEMREVVQAAEDARSIKSRMEMGYSKEEALHGFKNLNGRPAHPAALKIAEDLSGEELSRIASSPLEAYRRLYGEVEARNVQTRRDYSPEAREHVFPPTTEDVLPEFQTLGRGRPGRQGSMSLDEVDRILEQERSLGATHEPRPAAAPEPAAAADPTAVGPGGGGPSRARGLPEAQATAARWAGERQPLEGIPGPLKIGEDHFVPGPIGKIHDVAADYMRTHHPDRPYTPPERYHPLDPEHSKAIAQAYEDMKHTPEDPATKASYNALIDETAKQYQAIKNTGLKIEPIHPGMEDPYAANPRLAAHDVAENNHLWFFPTEDGLGTVNKITTDNPLLRPTGEKIGQHEMLANDMFRVVHDYFGHLKEGHGFRAPGEDNAWRAHSAMYSDLARPAMTTETRGQNSWVNYGPHGEKNRTASAADTTYADQKVGLMPEWTMRNRGSQPPIMVYHGSPHSFDRFNIKKIGEGEGNQAYGHGLYFAGHEPVSEWYRHQLAIRQDPLLKKYDLEDIGHVIGGHMSDAGGDAAKLATDYAALRQRLIEGGETDKATKNFIKDYDNRIKYLNDPERATGHLYQVGLDVNPERLLDYDAPFSSQSPYVQGRVGPEMEESVNRQKAAIQQTLERGTYENHPGFQGSGWKRSQERPLLSGARAGLEGRLLSLEQTGHTAFPGKEIYKRIGLPAKTEAEGSVKSARRLLGMDIPGLRYADAGSRAPGQKGSHNYVMFDDKMLRLLRQYGVIGIPAAGVLGANGEEQRARGGRVARRIARKARAGGGAAFGVMSPAEEADLDEPAPIKIGRAAYEGLGETAKRAFESSESLRRGEGYDPKPVLQAATLPMGTGAVAGAPVRGAEMLLGAGPVRRMADDAGAAMSVARKVKPPKYAEPEYAPSGNMIINKGVDNPPNPAVQTVADPHRMMYPGVYRNPRIIAEEAAARVGPEDPAMKQLFGVTRDDLREMAKGRVGNEEPNLRLAANPRGSLSAQNVQTPRNTQRLQDILGEAGKHEGLRTADAWYIMDPVYRRMEEMFGPEEAVKRYKMFNTSTVMASPGSDVMTEIQRGTAAHWLQNQGRFDDFKKFAGVPEEFRNRTAHFPQDMRYIGGHPYHRTAQSDPMQKFFDTGAIQSDAPKVPLYAHASGVPETGFQTSGPVGDAHFSRGVGLSDTRKGPTDVQGSFSRGEYQTLQPWWQHEVAGPSGLESVPAQARLWTALGPQTGVDSALGAPKLELLAKQIMEASRRLRISPERARDLILSGNAGAGMLGGAIAAPAVMDSMRERAVGGSVDAAMDVARRIKRAKGGKVHVGPILGDTDGRADEVPMEVPDGAYVLTADHCSSMGEGNTLSGFKKLNEMFPKSAQARTAKKEPIKRAAGGKVPIYAADGEYVICPEDIVERWGDLDHGHRILDAWQTAERKEHVKTLKNLAPPAQD